MKFVGSVKLQNPRTGQIRTKNFEADICDSGAQKYGNGKELTIQLETGTLMTYDIRYDTDYKGEEFEADYLRKFMEERLWTGENSSRKLLDVAMSPVEEGGMSL